MESIETKIEQLKRERNAVVLVHNYQLPEVQDLADFLGDSLQLSRQAAETEAEVIVFCGVHFMAETAKILSPDKTVLLPSLEAGCPMADMLTADDLRGVKAQHPDAVVVCYVNSTAAVKAETDYCCTSANAVQVVEAIEPGREIIFGPDQYLGQYVSEQTGRELILWHGYCPTHARIRPADIERLRAHYPGAVAIAHPECRKDIREAADEILSTGGMVRFARETDAREVIVGTEIGMIHRLQRECPEKTFIPVSAQAICPDMKMTRLGDVLLALEKMQFRITVPAETRRRAERAVQRMIAITEAVR